MRILLLGGTGFISSALTSMLLEEDHELTLLTRGLSGKPEENSDILTFVKGNRSDNRLLKNLANRKFDIVYDMIAYKEEESASASRIFRGKVGRFIHCSTISVYMVSDDVNSPITEDQDKGDLMEFWERNPFGMQYGIDKRKCEDVLWDAHHDTQFPVSMLRPTYVCGPNDPAARDFFWIERILDGGPVLVPGSGEAEFQNVYVNDVARAFVDLIYNDVTVGKAYNVADEESFSLNGYLLSLGQLLGKNPELVHVDQEIFEEQEFSFSADGDVFPYNIRRTAVFSLDKIKQDLNFKSTPFSDWMKLTIDWYLNHYKGHSVGYENRKDETRFIEELRETGNN